MHYIKITALILACVMFFACSHYKPFQLKPGQDNSGLKILEFRHIAQKQRYDCGPGALAIVLNYWGIRRGPERILAEIFQGRPPEQGTKAQDLVDYAEAQGLRAFLVQFDLEQIQQQIGRGRPLIICRPIFGRINHYEVVVGYDSLHQRVIIANPADGVVSCSEAWFRKIHQKSDRFVLLVVPEAQTVTNE